MARKVDAVTDRRAQLVVVAALLMNARGDDFPYKEARLASQLDHVLEAPVDRAVVRVAWRAALGAIGLKGSQLGKAALGRLTDAFGVQQWNLDDLHKIIESATEFLEDSSDARELIDVDGTTCAFRITFSVFDELIVEVGTALLNRSSEEFVKDPDLVAEMLLDELLLGNGVVGAAGVHQ